MGEWGKRRVVKRNRKTVGEINAELINKEPVSHDVRDYSDVVVQGKLPEEIDKAIADGKSKTNGDFFIEILSRDWSKIKGFHNTFGNYIFARLSCPTPHFDSTAFQYHRNTGSLERLWTIPNRYACINLLNNRKRVQSSHYEIMQDVIDFYDGKLLHKAKKINKEPTE